MGVQSEFQRRRAERALHRQLEYQKQKSLALAGREENVIAQMTQVSGRVRAILEALRPVSADTRVLEVGSGAHGLIFCFGAGRRVGLDPLAHHYASLFPAWQRRVPTVSAHGERLPFPDRSFDIVLCDNVVDHAESPARIVTEIARVLEPRGFLYFSVNVHHPAYAIASDIHAAWHRAGIDYDIGPFADHTVHLTLARARALFTGQPLTIVSDLDGIRAARESARRSRARHASDLLKRVFFKNARYELIAVRQ